MEKPKNSMKNTFAVFLVISFCLHILFFSSATLFSHFFSKKNLAQDIVEIEYVPEAPPASEFDKKMAEVQSKVAALKKQIVDQEQRVNDETPQDSRFLGAHNQTVKKQSIAKNHGAFQNMADSAPQRKGSSFTEKDQSSSPKPKAKSGGQESASESGLPTYKKLMAGVDWKEAVHKSLEKNERSGLEESQSTSQKAVSQTRDHLKDVESGLQTLLSTREFVYHSYYARIRNQLAQYWEPKIKDKVMHLFKQGRSIASSEDRVTQVIIVLDPTGTLVAVQVVGQSGVNELDDAAVEAFRAAAPFPNPPDGIVENDGTIKIRWDFVIGA